MVIRLILPIISCKIFHRLRLTANCFPVGEFEAISSITRTFEDNGWHKLKLYVSDVPNADGNLPQRLQQLSDYLVQNPTPYIEIIPQIPIKNKQHAEDFLAEIEQLGGEGIVVRNPQIPYQKQRSSQILKFKTTQDEECEVIAHHTGKGQFTDLLGAVSCRNQRGILESALGLNWWNGKIHRRSAVLLPTNIVD